MPTNRPLQFHTETPFLPQPIAGDVLASLVGPVATIAEGKRCGTVSRCFANS